MRENSIISSELLKAVAKNSHGPCWCAGIRSSVIYFFSAALTLVFWLPVTNLTFYLPILVLTPVADSMPFQRAPQDRKKRHVIFFDILC
jgi:hypothetical protein